MRKSSHTERKRYHTLHTLLLAGHAAAAACSQRSLCSASKRKVLGRSLNDRKWQRTNIWPATLLLSTKRTFSAPHDARRRKLFCSFSRLPSPFSVSFTLFYLHTKVPQFYSSLHHRGEMAGVGFRQIEFTLVPAAVPPHTYWPIRSQTTFCQIENTLFRSSQTPPGVTKGFTISVAGGTLYRETVHRSRRPVWGNDSSPGCATRKG